MSQSTCDKRTLGCANLLWHSRPATSQLTCSPSQEATRMRNTSSPVSGPTPRPLYRCIAKAGLAGRVTIDTLGQHPKTGNALATHSGAGNPGPACGRFQPDCCRRCLPSDAAQALTRRWKAGSRCRLAGGSDPTATAALIASRCRRILSASHSTSTSQYAAIVGRPEAEMWRHRVARR